MASANDSIAMAIKTVVLGAWDDIHPHAKRGWLFRGQRSANWELSTSFDRSCDRRHISHDKRRDVEKRLFREFRRTYHLYAQHIPDLRAVVEWLSLMQHHGAPTRLLDFTYSIFVAAYFATETADGDSAIWAIDGPWALARAAELLRGAGKSSSAVDRMLEPFQEGDEEVVADLFFAEPYVCCSWPINAFRVNERLRIQQGAFLIPGDVGRSFMENLAALMTADADDHLLKIVIPEAEGRKAPQRLFSMGVSRTSLFPGIDGYAQSLAVWNPAFDPFDWKRSV
jgi:hypothetical protein